VDVVDRSRELALLALQGPASAAILGAAGGSAFVPLRYYHAAEGRLGGFPVIVSRTGYTGEDGFEIAVEWDGAGAVWDLLMEAGRPRGLVPAGLGARDSLRLEVRYCLYGNDIDETTNPLEAGLGWTVKMDKPDFVGREALERSRREGLARRLIGFVAEGRDIPRHGYALRAGGSPAGRVTSGGFGPTVAKGIGMGYAPAEHAAPGGAVEIDCRGKWATARIVKGPFYPPRTVK
jgi:aminomethyltransferase